MKVAESMLRSGFIVEPDFMIGDNFLEFPMLNYTNSPHFLKSISRLDMREITLNLEGFLNVPFLWTVAISKYYWS